MKTLNATYFGIFSKEELIEKIASYLEDYTEWNYDNDDWDNEGFPYWTFSGSPNGDELTSHVQKFCMYGEESTYEDFEEEELRTENGLMHNFSFSDESDRIEMCKDYAERIAKTINLD